MPLVQIDRAEALAKLKKEGFRLLGRMAGARRTTDEADLDRPGDPRPSAAENGAIVPSRPRGYAIRRCESPLQARNRLAIFSTRQRRHGRGTARQRANIK